MAYDPVIADLHRYLREQDEREAAADAIEERIEILKRDTILMDEMSDLSPEHLEQALEVIATEQLEAEWAKECERNTPTYEDDDWGAE